MGLETLKQVRIDLTDPAMWQTGSIGPIEGPNCFGGRIELVGGGSEYAENAAYVNAFLPPPFTDLVAFNDAKGTTHTDVLAVLDQAIAAWQTDGGK